jgi:hypothetical protein
MGGVADAVRAVHVLLGNRAQPVIDGTRHRRLLIFWDRAGRALLDEPPDRVGDLPVPLGGGVLVDQRCSLGAVAHSVHELAACGAGVGTFRTPAADFGGPACLHASSAELCQAVPYVQDAGPEVDVAATKGDQLAPPKAGERCGQHEYPVPGGHPAGERVDLRNGGGWTFSGPMLSGALDPTRVPLDMAVIHGRVEDRPHKSICLGCPIFRSSLSQESCSPGPDGAS